MAFTAEQTEKIVAVLRERVPNAKCPMCHTDNWQLEDGLVIHPVQHDAKGLVLSGPSLPNVALLCTTCGNTQLLNVLRLGLGPLLGIEPIKKKAEPKPEEAKPGAAK
jgi:hypothetical protein